MQAAPSTTPPPKVEVEAQGAPENSTPRNNANTADGNVAGGQQAEQATTSAAPTQTSPRVENELVSVAKGLFNLVNGSDPVSNINKIITLEKYLLEQLQKDPYKDSFKESGDVSGRLQELQRKYDGLADESENEKIAVSNEVRKALIDEYFVTFNTITSPAGQVLANIPEQQISKADPAQNPPADSQIDSKPAQEEFKTFGDLRVPTEKYSEIEKQALIRARTWLVNDDNQIDMGDGKKAGYHVDAQGQLVAPVFKTNKDRDRFDKKLTENFKKEVDRRLHEIEPSLKKEDPWWSRTKSNVSQNFYSLGTSVDPNNRARSVVLGLAELETRAQLHAMSLQEDMKNVDLNLENRQTFSGQTPQQYRFNNFFPGGAMMGGMGGFGGGYWYSGLRGSRFF